ncbi:hypothetical protein BH23CHL5_BH23CHL5_23170 [soil metagenome]
MTRQKHKSRERCQSLGPSAEDRYPKLASRHGARIPANTLPAIAKALERLLRRADELANNGAAVMSPGVRCVAAGRQAEA